MAGGAVQQNGIFFTPQHLSQSPHMDPDLSDSRKRPLETPTEASSTKRSNTGGKIGQRSGLLLQISRAKPDSSMLESRFYSSFTRAYVNICSLTLRGFRRLGLRDLSI